MKINEKGQKNVIEWFKENTKFEDVDGAEVVKDAQKRLDETGGDSYEMAGYESKTGNPQTYQFGSDELEEWEA